MPHTAICQRATAWSPRVVSILCMHMLSNASCTGLQVASMAALMQLACIKLNLHACKPSLPSLCMTSAQIVHNKQALRLWLTKPVVLHSELTVTDITACAVCDNAPVYWHCAETTTASAQGYAASETSPTSGLPSQHNVPYLHACVWSTVSGFAGTMRIRAGLVVKEVQQVQTSLSSDRGSCQMRPEPRLG